MEDAKDALAWLGDEWRHRWPLAPEEILRYTHAGINDAFAERDIAGNRIFRATADLTKRLSKEFRQKNERCCFCLHTADETAAHLDEVRDRKIAGRTDRARERNRRFHDRYVAELTERLRIAVEHEAETARLRAESGVEDAKLRVKNARADVERAVRTVSVASANSIVGLRMKAEVIVHEMERRWGGKNPDIGFLADGYHLARALLDVTRGAS